MQVMRNATSKIVVALVTLVLCTAILEAALRIAGRNPSNTIEGFFVQHGLSYRLRPNITKVIRWPSYSYVAYTNSFGFRDRKVGDRHIEDRNYDVFLGSSAAFGNGVDYEESFVGVYDELSTRKDGIEALNLAVGGHQFRDQVQLFQEFMGSVKEKPRRVFICIDLNWLSTIGTTDKSILVKDGYLFNKKAWILPYLKVTLANASSVYCFLRDSIRTIQRKWGNGNDAQLREYLGMYSTGRTFEECDRYLDSVTNYCRGLGALPVYVYLQLTVEYQLRDALQSGKLDAGSYDLAQYASYMERYCRSRDVAYIDVSPVLSSYHETGRSLSFATDAHYNEQVSTIIGEYIYARMQH
jgi:hypothetical protein